MKILVPVKRVVDYNVKVRVKADGTGVETAGVKMSMNPFDEIAVEEAVRLKEKGVATEVIAVSLGVAAVPGDHPHRARDGRRSRHPGRNRCRSAAAGGGQAAARRSSRRSSRSLVIMGKQAIDDDMNATGQMLAALLGWPQGTFASKVDDRGRRR
ncbi:MAG: hypothetical protein QM753_11615 [Thermomicrobiales bacterium]